MHRAGEDTNLGAAGEKTLFDQQQGHERGGGEKRETLENTITRKSSRRGPSARPGCTEGRNKGQRSEIGLPQPAEGETSSRGPRVHSNIHVTA